WQLSGSGGAWFLLAPGDEVAAAAGALRAIFPDRACWSTRPVDHGWRLVTD
ncbi:MAG: hypothetical protein HUU35_19835, partial [Armatimonadetes bacterium]|nr:hypothetical protein [Armatimonadota bacterium]